VVLEEEMADDHPSSEDGSLLVEQFHTVVDCRQAEVAKKVKLGSLP
jgi:hypothetical protein